MQKFPNIDIINGATHGVWTEYLELRGYVWAPLQEPHIGYAGPEADFECEVIEVAADKTLVLTFGEVSYLLGYQGADDVPTIFSADVDSVELALRWVGAVR